MTSKALSVISGASKTTLVKILLNKDQVSLDKRSQAATCGGPSSTQLPQPWAQLQTGAGWCLKAANWPIGRVQMLPL